MSVQSALGGAASGAAIGSAVPILGTALGAGIGGLLGLFGGGPDKPAFTASSPGLSDQERQKRFAEAIQTAQNRPNVQMDTSAQDQFRQGQAGLVGQLQQQAAGTGPSISAEALRQARDAQMQQANALAASARGNVNPALLQRNILQQQALTGQQMAGQAAQGRIQEQLGAQQALGGILQGARGQDIGVAGQQAQLAIQSQAMKDELAARYEAMGLTADQAQLQAAMDAQRINAGLAGQQMQTSNQLLGGILSGAGGIASSLLSARGAPVSPGLDVASSGMGVAPTQTSGLGVQLPGVSDYTGIFA